MVLPICTWTALEEEWGLCQVLSYQTCCYGPEWRIHRHCTRWHLYTEISEMRISLSWPLPTLTTSLWVKDTKCRSLALPLLMSQRQCKGCAKRVQRIALPLLGPCRSRSQWTSSRCYQVFALFTTFRESIHFAGSLIGWIWRFQHMSRVQSTGFRLRSLLSGTHGMLRLRLVGDHLAVFSGTVLGLRLSCSVFWSS